MPVSKKRLMSNGIQLTKCLNGRNLAENASPVGLITGCKLKVASRQLFRTVHLQP